MDEYSGMNKENTRDERCGNAILPLKDLSITEKTGKKAANNKEVLYIGDVLCCDSNQQPSQQPTDLQASFLKFREQKLKEKKLMKMYQEQLAREPRTIEYKAALRAKFIEQAKKYLGVPYARRFQSADTPVAPLYLDCCGLIRKSLWDLQSEFGFLIGRWNQAYQMDVLPVVLEEKELQPGDLIFYEGKYLSSRSKPQKHNNVHVEIFLGGETGNHLFYSIIFYSPSLLSYLLSFMLF